MLTAIYQYLMGGFKEHLCRSREHQPALFMKQWTVANIKWIKKYESCSTNTNFFHSQHLLWHGSKFILLKLFFVSMNDHQLTQDPRHFVVWSSHHSSKEDKHMSRCKLNQFLSYSSHPFGFIWESLNHQNYFWALLNLNWTGIWVVCLVTGLSTLVPLLP